VIRDGDTPRWVQDRVYLTAHSCRTKDDDDDDDDAGRPRLRIIYWGRGLFSGDAAAGRSFADCRRRGRTLRNAPARINSFGAAPRFPCTVRRAGAGRIIQIYRTPNAILSRHLCARDGRNPFCLTPAAARSLNPGKFSPA